MNIPNPVLEHDGFPCDGARQAGSIPATGANSAEEIMDERKGDCTVIVRRNSDGAISQSRWQFWDWSSEWPEYIWEEGNYACDCNRAIFFASGRGEPQPDRACGMNDYAVRVIGPDGVTLYEDGDDWPQVGTVEQ